MENSPQNISGYTDILYSVVYEGMMGRQAALVVFPSVVLNCWLGDVMYIQPMKYLCHS